MLTIGEILKNHEQKQKAKSERADIIRQFVEAINLERDGRKYKKLTPYYVAMKLSHIKKKGDLYYFLSQCKDYKERKGSFSKYFWWAIRPQENPQEKMF